VNGFCYRLELEVEPIFASMALYDAKERKKVQTKINQVPENTILNCFI